MVKKRYIRNVVATDIKIFCCGVGYVHRIGFLWHKLVLFSTHQNSYSISYLLFTVTGQWQCSQLLTTAGSTVTTQLIDCVVTVLPAVNNGDYTATVQSLCLVGD